jgi:GT2 family glycosyltransferase
MNLLVTITYNGMEGGILPPFFECLAAQRDQNFEVLVIDNASSDGTADYLRSLELSNLHLILNKKNIGFGRACNQGIDFARQRKANYVTFINNDTEFEPGLIGGMVAALKESGAAGLSPLITFYDQPNRIWFLSGSYRWNRGMIPYHDSIGKARSIVVKKRWFQTAFAPGCCLIFRIDVFDAVPGFDPGYFVYWEDADLCLCLQAKGLRVITDATLECRHKVSVSTGGAFSDFSIHHFNRGHMIFVRKHFGKKALTFVLPIVAIKTLFNVLCGRMKIRQLPVWIGGIYSGIRAEFIK